MGKDTTLGVVGAYHKMKVKPLRDLAKSIVENVTEKKCFWRKPWNSEQELAQASPYNYATGSGYTGLANLFILRERMEQAAHEEKSLETDPRFMTLNQFKKIEGKEPEMSLRKGSKAVHIYAPIVVKKEVTKEIDSVEEQGTLAEDDSKQKVETKTIAIGFRKFPVFNGSQFDGLPPFRFLPEHEDKLRQAIYNSLENIMDKMNISVSHGGDRACYKPSRDHIQMPHIDSFVHKDSYASTLLHEIAHATGHPSRTDRVERIDKLIEGLDLKKEDVFEIKYAIEELVADMASTQLCMRMSMTPFELENHESYLKSWLGPLQSKIKDEEKILDVVEGALKMSEFAASYAMKLSGNEIHQIIKEVHQANYIKNSSPDEQNVAKPSGPKM